MIKRNLEFLLNLDNYFFVREVCDEKRIRFERGWKSDLGYEKFFISYFKYLVEYLEFLNKQNIFNDKELHKIRLYM